MRRWLMLGALLTAALPVNAQEYGSDWTVAYFNSTDLSGEVVTSEVVDRIDFTFGDDLPDSVDEEGFSLRAETRERLSEGTYRFRLGSDDGARLEIDGTLALDRFELRSYTEDTVDVFLNDAVHTIEIEYFQDVDDARLTLSWEKISDDNLGTVDTTANNADTGGAFVPAMPEGQVATGSVRNVEGLSVRSGPFLGASRLAIIEPGTEYPVFARNNAEGEFTWYFIEVQNFIEVIDDVTGEQLRQNIGDPIRGWTSGRYFLIDTADANVPATATIFETLDNPAPTGVRGILRSNMRLRQGASYRTSTLEILDWGAEVEIVGRTIQGNQNHWFQVIYEDQVGWLFAPFITIEGDINIVPTY